MWGAPGHTSVVPASAGLDVQGLLGMLAAEKAAMLEERSGLERQVEELTHHIRCLEVIAPRSPGQRAAREQPGQDEAAPLALGAARCLALSDPRCPRLPPSVTHAVRMLPLPEEHPADHHLQLAFDGGVQEEEAEGHLFDGALPMAVAEEAGPWGGQQQQQQQQQDEGPAVFLTVSGQEPAGPFWYLEA